MGRPDQGERGERGLKAKVLAGRRREREVENGTALKRKKRPKRSNRE